MVIIRSWAKQWKASEKFANITPLALLSSRDFLHFTIIGSSQFTKLMRFRNSLRFCEKISPKYLLRSLYKNLSHLFLSFRLTDLEFTFLVHVHISPTKSFIGIYIFKGKLVTRVVSFTLSMMYWVVIYAAIWAIFKPKLEKIKKKSIPKKDSYISGNGTFLL